MGPRVMRAGVMRARAVGARVLRVRVTGNASKASVVWAGAVMCAGAVSARAMGSEATRVRAAGARPERACTGRGFGKVRVMRVRAGTTGIFFACISIVVIVSNVLSLNVVLCHVDIVILVMYALIIVFPGV